MFVLPLIAVMFPVLKQLCIVRMEVGYNVPAIPPILFILFPVLLQAIVPELLQWEMQQDTWPKIPPI